MGALSLPSVVINNLARVLLLYILVRKKETLKSNSMLLYILIMPYFLPLRNFNRLFLPTPHRLLPERRAGKYIFHGCVSILLIC